MPGLRPEGGKDGTERGREVLGNEAGTEDGGGLAVELDARGGSGEGGEAPRGKAQGMGHVGFVRGPVWRAVAHSSVLSPGRSSLTKRSKSSAAWKFL